MAGAREGEQPQQEAQPAEEAPAADAEMAEAAEPAADSAPAGEVLGLGKRRLLWYLLLGGKRSLSVGNHESQT